MISQLVQFNTHEQKYARVSVRSHKYVTRILNKDSISLTKITLAEGKNGKTQCSLLLSAHETVGLSRSAAEDCCVFHTEECSGARRAPPPLPFPARSRVPERSSRGDPPPPQLRISRLCGALSKRHGSAGAAGGADTALPAVTSSRQSRRARLPQRRARAGAGAYTQLSPGLSSLSGHPAPGTPKGQAQGLLLLYCPSQAHKRK